MSTRSALFVAFCVVVLAGCDAANRQGSAPSASVEEGVTEYCRLTRTIEPIGECARLQAQYEDLDAGVDAFKPSEKVREYEPLVIRYAITRLPDAVQGEGGELAEAVPEDDANGTEPSPAETGPTQQEIDTALAEAEEVVTQAIEAEPGDEEIETRVIKLGRMMQACLQADSSFELDEATRCQTLDTSQLSVAVWRWTVTPTAPGNHTLIVSTSVALSASDGTPRFAEQKSQLAPIAVEVTAYGRWKRFLVEAEAWVRSPLGLLAALTVLVGAIGLLIGAVRRARKGQGPATGDGDKP